MNIIIIIKKRVGSARLRESDIHPISPKTPAPQYQPRDRKRRKGKRVEHYSRDRAANVFLLSAYSMLSAENNLLLYVIH